MKRTSLVLWFLLLLAGPETVQAQFTYTTNNGVISLSAYTGTGRTVVISNFVTSIGQSAFYEKAITSVAMSGSVTSIGYSAFAECQSLTNVMIGNSVTTIADYAFADCYSLTGAIIPASVTNIGIAPFAGASLTAITVDTNNPAYSSVAGVLFDKSQTTLIEYPARLGQSYTIPDGVTNIGFEAFYDTPLTTVTVPNTVTSIAGYAFSDTALTSVYFTGNAPTTADNAFAGDSATAYYLPGTTGWVVFSANTGLPAEVEFSYSINAGNANSITITHVYGAGLVIIPTHINGLLVTVIGDGVDSVFATSGATGITIPNSVNTIAPAAFEECLSLTSVTIPNGVLNIGSNAFSFTSLTSVAIPASVTNIGTAAFVPNYSPAAPIPSLTAINVDANNPAYSSVAGVLFNKNQSALLQYPAGKAGAAYTIPPTVISIGIEAFLDAGVTTVAIPEGVTTIGADAFAGCPALTAITVEAGNPFYASITGILFNKSQTVLIQYPSGLGGSYMVPDTVTSVGAGAFAECGGLTGITIPNSVTSIGDEAFVGTSLTSVTIPGSVTNIGQSDFFDCTSLTSAMISSGVTSIGPGMFDYCPALQNVTIPNTVTSIGSNAFVACTSLTAITIPNSVTKIGDYAFNDCAGLVAVLIPSNVTRIGDHAFQNCTGLSSMTIPGGVSNIGVYAFAGCTGLNTVTIPGSVTNIGGEAFYGCARLTVITVDTNNPAYSSVTGVLFNKSQTTLIQYPLGNVEISYAIPNGVTNIGDYAFFDSYSLTGLYFQGNAPTADLTVFAGDINATVYYLPGTTGWGSTFAGVPTMELAEIAITAIPTSGVVPLTVSFTSAGADRTGHAVTNRSWNFGDGSTSPAQNPSHTYTAAGVFSVALIETSLSNVLAAGSGASITVYGGTVAFAANPTNGMAPLTVNFISSGVDSAGNTISNRNWTFGDGSTSVVQNPSHTYTVTGTFSPSLIATNSIGGTVAGLGPAAITTTPTTNCISPPSGLISWWPGQSNAVDIADGNNGTVTGGVTFTNGEVGQAFNFDGATGFVSTSLLVTNPQSFSLSLWFRTATTQGGVLMGFGQSKSNTTANYDRNLYLDNTGAIHFGVYQSIVKTVGSAPGYNDNRWHQVVASLASSTGISLYVDGVFAGNYPAANSAANYNGYWIIGENNLGAWPFQPSSFYFNGQIDEVSIFNRVLSVSEVQSIYDAAGAGMCEPEPVVSSVSAVSGAVGSAITIQGTNLAAVAAVMFDGTSAQFIVQSSGELIVYVPTNATAGPITLETLNGGTVTASSSFTVTVPECTPPPSGLISWWPGQSNALDIAGGNNGTLIGGVTFANGEVGQAFNFDGTTGFVSTSLLVTNPQSFSLSLWFKTTSMRGGVLLGFGQRKSNTAANYDRNLYLDNTGAIHFGVFESTEEVVNSAAGYNDDLCHQVVASLSASTGISLYVDGVLAGTNPAANSAASYNGYWIIGENNLGGWPFQPSSYYFKGEIDEISIFRRALSASEVQSIYVAASAGMCNGLIFDTSPAGLRWTKSGLELQLDGLTELGPVVIYASSNLVSWTPIYTNPPIASPIQFLDPTATNLPFRFYRAAQQ
jgi:PKD repeat protein